MASIDTLTAKVRNALKKTGDAMISGHLTLFQDPTQPMHATTKQYVDATSGSGEVPWNVVPGDKPPTSPNAKDDEFNGASGAFDAKWTWVNQGTASATVSGLGYLTFTRPNAAATSSLLVQSAPSFPCSIRSRVTADFRMQNFAGAGLALRDSGSGRIIHYNVGFVNGQTIACDRWSDANTFNTSNKTRLVATATSEGALTPPYIRIDLGASQGDYYWSFDGVSWTYFTTETYAAWLTPNQIGISALTAPPLANSFDAHFFWFRVT